MPTGCWAPNRSRYNITDDEPAPMSEWLPALAAALGARPPRHVPLWLARLIAGKGAVMMADGSRGASNAKAKRELGWTLRYPSWRQGFPAVYGDPAWRPAQETSAQETSAQ
jgi:2-alkyl-3-oxoalkanoate reductase